MPLAAYLYSQKISAPFLTDNEWNHVKKSLKQNPEYLHFKCCNSPVYARVSKKGLRHFVHKNTDSCNYIHESEDHLLLKLEVHKACQDNGWDAEIEFAGDNFRADVLASNGKHKVAFEIQLTRQDFQTTVNRQRAFEEAGIRCAWFFKRIPKDYRPDKFLPLFELDIDNDRIQPYRCNVSGKEMPVRECVELLLKGNIKYRKNLVVNSKQQADIYLFENECYRCGHLYLAVGPWSVIKSKCEIGIENVDFDEKSLAAKAKEIIDESRSINPNAAIFKRSYSKTINAYYWANNCPKCKAIFGKHYLLESVLHVMNIGALPFRNVSYKIDNTSLFKPTYRPHWCIKGPEGFCDN